MGGLLLGLEAEAYLKPTPLASCVTLQASMIARIHMKNKRGPSPGLFVII
jgi:hypothetical protein